MPGRVQTGSRGSGHGRLGRLLVALVLFAISLALAAPGLAQSGDPTTTGPSQDQGYPDATPAESKAIFEREAEPTLDSLGEQAQPLGEDDRVLEYRGSHIALVAPDGFEPSNQTPQPTPEARSGEGAAETTGDQQVTPSLVLSDLPLRSDLGTGRVRPVDLSLDRSEPGFVASNPLVDVAASAIASQGIVIGEGQFQIRVAAASAGEGSPAGSSVNDLGVFYPEVATDTDMFAAPTPLGAEVFNQLRSPQAPERIELAIGLPQGSELLSAGTDGAAVVMNGERVAHVAPPTAFDGEGRPVPVRMDVEGSSLVLQVEHQSGSFTYPILVDPAIDSYDTWGSQQVVDWQRSGYPNDGSLDTSKFYTRKQDPGQGAWAGALNKSWGPGLYVYANKNKTFNENDYAGWVYSPPRYVTTGLPGAPGTTAFVNQARFNPVQFRINGDTGAGVVGDVGNGPRLKVGIFKERTNSEAPRGIGAPNGNSPFNAPGLNGPYYQADGPIVTYNNSDGTANGNANGGDPTGRQAWFHLAAPVARTTQALRESYLGGAEIYLSDGENPGALISNASVADPSSTPWFNGTAARGISVAATDKAANAAFGGLGVRSTGYQLRGPGGGLMSSPAQTPVLSSGTTQSCDGSHKLPCPISSSRSFTYQTSGLPNGANYGLGLATDASDKTQPFSGNLWWIKVDREVPPPAKPTGGLSGRDESGQNPPGKDLSVHAVDGDETATNIWSAADRQKARSGVAWIELKRGPPRASPSEMTVVRRATQPCTRELGSCSMDVDFTQDVATLPPGRYRFEVTVGDQAGNVSEPKVWTDRVEPEGGDKRITPQQGKLGLEQYFQYDSTETGLSGAHANLATGNLVWHKVPMVNPGRGLSSVLNLTYNSYDYPALGDVPLDSRFLGLDYDEAGLGFSVGLSGITRINEPLGGVLIPNVIGAKGTPDPLNPSVELGAVTMTDPDGTTHIFQPDTSDSAKSQGCVSGLPTRYVSPPGVNLELRRFGCPADSVGAVQSDAVRLVKKVLGSRNPNAADDPLLADDFLDLRLNPGEYSPELWPSQDGAGGQKLSELVAISDLQESLAESFKDLYLLEKDDLWAITRPDGVTYYFNGFGFATKIVDRDGNTIRYVYENVNPLGEPCPQVLGKPSPIIPGLCEPRLSKMVDAAGNDPNPSSDNRAIKLEYYSLADAGLSAPGQLDLNTIRAAIADVRTKLTNIGKTAEQVEQGVNQLNKLKAITDHAGHRMVFSYDPKGRLTRLLEGAETAGASGSANLARATDFTYDSPPLLNLLDHPQLATVSDPHFASDSSAPDVTRFTYDTHKGTDALGFEPGRRVIGVSDRDTGDGAPNDRTYAYTGEDDNLLGAKASSATVRDARGTETRYELDSFDRPVSITEANAVATGMNAADKRTTLIQWDNGSSAPTDNNVTKLTRAAGITGEESPATFAYDNPNGMLSSQKDALGHETKLAYCGNNGTQLSRFGTDTSRQFVSDQLSITRPKLNAWRYELDGIARQQGEADSSYCSRLKAPVGTSSEPRKIVGRQTAQIDPAGYTATTTYDNYGQITSETDEEGDKTVYFAFDSSGLPQGVVDPEGFDLEAGEQGTALDEKQRHSWVYDYDLAGNLESVTDPRAKPAVDPDSTTSVPKYGETSRYTTTLRYDALNRLQEEIVPRDTDRETASDRVYIRRKYDYDAADNLTSQTDGEGKTTEMTYTAMDRPVSELTPSVLVDENDGTPNAERLLTRYCYDGEEALTRILSPEATRNGKGCASPESNHAMSFQLDALGRQVASVQESADPAKDLITSYAYDHRDNQTRIVDPRANQDRNFSEAVQAAAAGNGLRLLNAYDLADRLTSSVERPGDPVALKTTYEYDDNDNLFKTVSPRGNAPGADPALFDSIRSYDSRDLLRDVSDPLGNTGHYDYDKAGRMTAQVSPRGSATSLAGDHTTTMSYDRNGDLIARTMPWADGQYGIADRTSLGASKFTYERSPVGDPLKVTDPRGTTISNGFYDSGELKSTNRPWYWRLDWSSPYGNPQAGNRYVEAMGGLAADLAAPPGGPVLAEGGSPPPAGERELPQGSMAGDFGNVAPEELPDFLPRAGETKFSYDKVGRLKGVVDSTGGERKLSYDDLGRLTTKTWPFGTGAQASRAIEHRFTYDANGNLSSYLDGAGAANEYPGQINAALPVTGGLTAADYTTTFAYDAFERRISERSPGSLPAPGASSIPHELTQWAYDPNGNVTSRTTPRDTGFTFAYDRLDRLTSETNPVGSAWSYAYDPNSNPVKATNPRGYITMTGFDEADRVTSVREGLERNPDAPAGTDPASPASVRDISGISRTTIFALDPAGNVTSAVEPGAAPYPGADAAKRVTEIAYDGLEQPWKTTTGKAEPSSSVPAASSEVRTQITERDRAGNVVREVEGLGIIDSGTNAGKPLDKSHPVAEQFNPYAGLTATNREAATERASVHVYDADGLRTDTYLPHGPADQTGGSSPRPIRYKTTMTYDGRGRLRSLDHAYDFKAPSPKTTRVAYTYFETDWIRSSSDARDVAAVPGDPPADQTLRYDYDHRGVQTDWLTEGYRAGAANGRHIQRVINPSGTLYRKLGTKYLVSGTNADDPGDIDSSKRTYSYFYNPNRSLTQIEDHIPTFAGAPSDFDYDRTTLITRDPAERERRVQESWRGGRDTVYTYDANNNVTTRRVDGKLVNPGALANDPADDTPCTGSIESCTYSGGRTSGFTYDPLDREQTMDVAGRRSTTSWWPSDQLRSRTKLNGTIDSRFYLRSGDLARQVRDPEQGSTTTQTYDYDRDGNRLFDERGAHAYNARGQQVRWDKPSSSTSEPGYAAHAAEPTDATQRNYAEDPADYPEGGSVEYTLDGTGQTLKTVEHRTFSSELTQGGVPLDVRASTTLDTTSTFEYVKGNLDSVLAESQASTSGFPDNPVRVDTSTTKTRTRYEHYDDLGNVGRIRVVRLADDGSEPTAPADDSPTAPGCPSSITSSWDGRNTTYHCYDEFGRLAVVQAPRPEDKDALHPEPPKLPESWIYDGLDRRDVRLINDSGTTRSRERYYVGTSELLSREQDLVKPSGGLAATETETKIYDYDAQGMRLGQTVSKPTSGGASESHYSTYEHDAGGSVIGLEDESGTFDDPTNGGTDTDNVYHYDPYGEVMDPDPGNSITDVETELGDAAAENPFRYEGFYYDSGIQSYDMQARQYRPDIGRFLSQDRFEASGADLALQSDPLTQNRYAFAGGNPVSNIEWDGHKPADCIYCDATGAAMDNPSTKPDEGARAAAGKTVPAGSLQYTGPTPAARERRANATLEIQVQHQVTQAAASSNFPLEDASQLEVDYADQYGRWRQICYVGNVCPPPYFAHQPPPLPSLDAGGPSAGDVASGAFQLACGSSPLEQAATCGTLLAGKLVSVGLKLPRLVAGIRSLFVATNVVTTAEIAARFNQVRERAQALRRFFFGGRAARGVDDAIRATGPGARYPLNPKIQEQLGPRGWTTEKIDEAIKSGEQVRAINKATPGPNPATRYIHPDSGQSVVVDDVTGQVIHVGGPGYKYGPGSGDVP